MRTRKSLIRRASAVLVGMTAAVVSACANPETQARDYTASGDAYTSRRQFNEAVIQYRRALAETLMPLTCTTSWGVLIRRSVIW